jgi:hypothetical protein
MQTIAIPAIEQFKKAFLPFGSRSYDGGILYPFKDKVWAERAEAMASQTILESGFAVVATVEDYELNGTRRVGLVIRPVPEEHSFLDETQDDEGLTGGWWNTKSE